MTVNIQNFSRTYDVLFSDTDPMKQISMTVNAKYLTNYLNGFLEEHGFLYENVYNCKVFISGMDIEILEYFDRPKSISISTENVEVKDDVVILNLLTKVDSQLLSKSTLDIKFLDNNGNSHISSEVRSIFI